MVSYRTRSAEKGTMHLPTSKKSSSWIARHRSRGSAHRIGRVDGAHVVELAMASGILRLPELVVAAEVGVVASQLLELLAQVGLGVLRAILWPRAVLLHRRARRVDQVAVLPRVEPERGALLQSVQLCELKALISHERHCSCAHKQTAQTRSNACGLLLECSEHLAS